MFSVRLRVWLLLLTIGLAGCSATATAAAPQLYVDPQTHAAQQVATLTATGNLDAAKLLSAIADQPVGLWLTGAASDATTAGHEIETAATAGATPVLVLYNIPNRDAGAGLSKGGAASDAAYRIWIGQIAAAIGSHAAIVILEPDAVASVASGQLAGAAATTRLAELADAMAILATHPAAQIYLDAGNVGWASPAAMVKPLQDAGVTQAKGIAVNVANFYSDDASVDYAHKIHELLGGGGIVVDTSRNGHGPATGNNAWCNPGGRALGRRPEIVPGSDPVDAWLWIKPPGESDGTCNGGPPAGQFWLPYALGLVAGSS